MQNQIIKSLTSLLKPNLLHKTPLFNLHNLNMTPEKVSQFHKEGYAVLDQVVDLDQLDQVIEYTKQMIKKDNIFQKQRTIFESGKAMRGLGFLETGDKIHYFFENDAFNDKNELQCDESVALNKIGHAQHDLDGFFEQFCYQEVFKTILQKVGYKQPRLVQSMYIFKNPKIGAEVVPHTDNSYLITNPLSCMGIWIALHDATIENGCMWGVPGSNKDKTDYFMNRSDDNQNTLYVGKEPEYDISEAKCLEVKRGSIILLNGDFVHFSKHNSSLKPRHAFTLHFTEGEEVGYKWDPKNWMQRGEHLPFRNYYEVTDKVSQQEWKNYV